MDKRNNRKDKIYDEYYGKPKADRIKLKLSKAKKGIKRGTFEERYGKVEADKMKLKRSKNLKGKNTGTLEERFGKPKADRIKLKLSKARKGISLEERFGKPKADRIKLKLSKNGKGKNTRTLEERYGKPEADRIKLKMSKTRKGKKFGTLEERYGKLEADRIKLQKNGISTIWTKEKIINNLINIIKKIGPITRSNLYGLNHFYDICGAETIRKQFGSIDNLAIEGNIKFKLSDRRGKIGGTEKQILDDIEKEQNIVLLRQFSIAGKYIDGYDKENNVAYEVDEWQHKYQKVEDIIREDKIIEILDCEFVRVRG